MNVCMVSILNYFIDHEIERRTISHRAFNRSMMHIQSKCIHSSTESLDDAFYFYCLTKAMERLTVEFERKFTTIDSSRPEEWKIKLLKSSYTKCPMVDIQLHMRVWCGILKCGGGGHNTITTLYATTSHKCFHQHSTNECTTLDH